MLLAPIFKHQSLVQTPRHLRHHCGLSLLWRYCIIWYFHVLDYIHIYQALLDQQCSKTMQVYHIKLKMKQYNECHLFL